VIDGVRALRLAVVVAALCLGLVGCSSSGPSGGGEQDPYVSNPAFREGLDESLERFRNGDLRGALKPAVSALLAAPEREEPYARISMIYDAMGLHEEAVPFFRKTTERFPESAPAFRFLGYHEFVSGNWEDALEAYRRASSLAPEDPEAHFRQGLILQARGSFDEAVVELQRARECDRADPVIAARLARVLRITGNYDGARSVVEEALRTSPGSPDLQFALGQLEMRGGDLEGAETALRGAIGARPDYREAHEELAKLLRRAGREAEGQREAVIAERLGDYIELTGRLRAILADRPTDSRAMLALAETELTENRPAEAERWLDRAASHGAPRFRIDVARAEAAFARGDRAAGQAIVDRLEAPRGNPDELARLELARAAAAVAAGRREQAIAMLDSVVEAGPDEREWLRRAADLYVLAGDLEASDETHARASLADTVLASLEIDAS
jgi:tetratricopeptide (TPR) repeat protein